MKNTTIYLARLTVEAASPLGIGSGRRGLNTDRLVARDAYGLPYLPGTSLAGCLRSAFTEALGDRYANDFFGTQSGDDGGWGSRVNISSGHLIGSDGKVVGESSGLPNYKDEFLKQLTDGWLPERDHVRINSRGVADAKGHGKFDEQLVPRGVRFVFDVSLTGGEETDAEKWKTLIEQFYQPFFRIGGGTRKGFGKLEIVEVQQCVFDLRKVDQLNAYLGLSSALDQPLPPAFTTSIAPAASPSSASSNWLAYTLTLTARDFFQFGRRYGSNKADKLPKQETVIIWNNGKPSLLQDEQAPYLIPATSVKGALSHRTAFHYNRLQKVYAEDRRITAPTLDKSAAAEELLANFVGTPDDVATIDKALDQLRALRDGNVRLEVGDSLTFEQYKKDLDAAQSDEGAPHIGEGNGAVRALFGHAVEREEKDKPQRGHVLVDDVFLSAKKVKEKAFSHVMIDRFTGGAKDGALFTEGVTATKETVVINIHVHESAFSNGDKHIREAFEAALADLAEGRLLLGGGVAKGHGIFTGTIQKPAKTQSI